MADFTSGGTSKDQMKKNEEFQSVLESGNPPPRRVDNAEAAYNIYDKLRKEMEILAYNRSRVQGQQDGNAPYSRNERKRLGLNWMSNVNFGRARATTRLNATSIWNMFTSVQEFINLTLLDPKKDKDPQEPSADHGAVISEEFTKILLESPNFHYDLMVRIKEMVIHGLGPCYWKDEIDWRSESVKIANVLFPSKTKSKVSDLHLLCIRDTMDPVDLFAKIGNGDPKFEEIASEEGWNVEHVKNVLIQAYRDGQPGHEEYSPSEWENLQTKIKNHDYEHNFEFEGVRIVHMLSDEIGSGVTHMIFAEWDPGKREDGKPPKRAFMFKKHSRFACMSCATHFFMFDIGNGYMSSVRGLGYELFHTDDVANKMMNTVIDGSIMSSGLIVQPQSGDDITKMSVTKVGPVTMVPPNLSIQQSSFAPPIDKSIQTISLMSQTENNNAGVYQTRADATSRKARTATEVENEQINEARFQTNQAAWYYVQWEAWLHETFNRMMNTEYPEGHGGYSEHEKLLKRCKSRGVPDDLLDPEKWHLKAVRAIGLGSPVEAVRHTNFLLTLANTGSLDERGRMNAIRDSIQVRMGNDMVERYKPLQDRDKIETSEHSMANLENNDMIEGSPAIAGTDQPHKIHLNIHIARMVQTMNSFSENPDANRIPQIVVYFETALQHCLSHLQLLAKDPSRKNEIEEYQGTLQTLAKFSDQLKTQAQAMQKAQQEEAERQQQVVREAEEALKGQEFQLEMEKIKSNERIEMERNASMDRVRDAKTISNINNANIKARADMERKLMLAISEIQRENAKLQSELNKLNREVSAAEGAGE